MHRNNKIRVGLLLLFLSYLLLLSCDQINDPPESAGISVIHAWSHPVDNIWVETEFAQPVINNDKVYYIADTSLVCRDMETGDLIWETGMGNTATIWSSNIIFSNNRLYFNHKTFMRCYSADNGELIWSNDSHDVCAMIFMTHVATNVSYLFNPGNNNFTRIEKETGVIDRVIELESRTQGRVPGRVEKMTITADNHIYIPAGYYSGEPGTKVQGNIFCYDAESGEYIWEYNIPNRKILPAGQQDSVLINASLYSTAVWEDYLYTAAGQSVIALDRFTGELKWETFFEDAGFIHQCFGADNGKVFSGATSGIIYGFDGITGDVIWETPTQSTAANPIVLKDNRLYFCNNTGSGLWILDQETGKVLWHEKEYGQGGYYSPVAVGEGYMVNVGSVDVFGFILR